MVDGDNGGVDWPGLESLPPTPPTEWAPPRTAPAPARPVPAAPLRAGRHRLTVAAAVAAVLAVAAGGLLAVSRYDASQAASPSDPPARPRAPRKTAPSPTAPRSTTTDTTLPPADPPAQAAAAEVGTFVAALRRHTFVHPVPVERLDGEAFNLQARSYYTPDLLAEIEEQGNRLELLGLVPPGQDYVKGYVDERAARALGYYDPVARKVWLRGRPGTPVTEEEKEVLAHELTHALDDQEFPMDRPTMNDPDTEVDFGYLALLEGNAMRVEEEWARRHGRSPEQRGPATYPDALSAGAEAKNDFGSLLIRAIADHGGEPAIDAALADPPVTSEQVLHPEKFLAHEPEADVDPPPTDRRRSMLVQPDVGPPLGELMTRQMLATAVDPGRAAGAAAGWGGDATVMWTPPAGTGGTRCVRTRFAMDTPQDLTELEAAFTVWAGKAPGRSVRRAGDRLDVTAC